MAHEGCVCGQGWRVETTHLQTGQVLAVLHCVSMEWSVPDSQVGVGQIQVATREPAAADIFPTDVGIYISRVLPDGTRFGHFGGYIEGFNGDQSSDTRIAFPSIEEYLFHRLLADADSGIRYQADQRQQTLIAADLVGLAAWNGIPLFADPRPSTQLRDRVWEEWELKNLGEALDELTKVESGVRYRLHHEYNNGFWRTRIEFADTFEVNRGIVLRSDEEGWKYGLEIDGKNKATRVYAVGEGEEAAQLISVAYDESNTGPEWHAAPAWKDVVEQSTLDDHAVGHVARFRDPVATPGMTVAGMHPEPQNLVTQDRVTVDIGFGVLTYKGEAFIQSQTWKVQVDEPVQRVLAFQPVERSSLSIKTQVPIVSPEPAPAPVTPPGQQPPQTAQPDPKPGLLCRIATSTITESSGLQYSRNMPHLVWTHNDENEARQIRGIEIPTGKPVASITFTGVGARVDPEAIRIDPQGRLLLADIGDNTNSRGTVAIFRCAEPTSLGNKTVPAEQFTVDYNIGSMNAECLLVHPVSGQLWIITKEAGGGRLLRGPTSNALGPGTNTFVNQSIPAPLPKLVTDGVITQNGKFALLRAAGVQATQVYDTTTWKRLGDIPTPAVTKGESITLEDDWNRSFLVGSEGVNSPIFRVILPTWGRRF